MNINPTKIYENRTKKYLLPCVRQYGSVFTTKMQQVLKVAIGYDDYNLRKSGRIYDQHLFFLVNTTTSRRYFLNTMKWLKQQPMYEYDYPFDNPLSGYLHMIVVKLPECCKSALYHFKRGKYRRMYKDDILKEVFLPQEKQLKIFNPDRKLKEEFAGLVNQEFDSNITVESLEEEGNIMEVDFPPVKYEEIFNYPKK